MRICYMFPGQGTQRPGMLREMSRFMAEVEYVFDIASEVSGKNVKELCLQASAEELQKTENTQIAVTAMNLAYLALLEKQGVRPDVVMGHSLGQFSALAAAKVLSVEQVFELVQKRAELMSTIRRPGMLCSILGLDLERVSKVCAELDAPAGHVVVALHNSPNQVVIGGDVQAVQAAEEVCKERGALRTVPVRVSNAFHTPLMEEMVAPMQAFVDEMSFSEPVCGLVLNCKGDYAEDTDEIKREIVQQCCHTVQWTAGIQKVLGETEPCRFLEVGSGKVLTGLLRSIDSTAKSYLISNPAQLNRFLQEIKEEQNV